MKSVNMRKAALSAVLALAGFAANALTVLTTFETPELVGTPAPLGSSQSMSSAAFATWMATGGVPGWSSNAAIGFGEVGGGSAGNLGQQYLFLSVDDIVTYTYSGLTPGTSYQLVFSFDYSGAAGPASNAAGKFAIKNGSTNVVGDTDLIKDTSAAGASINTYFDNLGQAPAQNLSFTAVGTSLAFIFYAANGLTGGNTHLAIDNVSVGITALPVPEPGTYALLLAGLGAIGYVARKRLPRG
jgi:PEP-CTERM motif